MQTNPTHHDCPLLGVQFGAVDVEAEAVLVPNGLVLGDVELRAKAAVLCGVEGVVPGGHILWGLRREDTGGVEGWRREDTAGVDQTD